MKISITLTKKGLPALWEEGGGWTNTGSATIVAGPHGERLSPIYTRRAGDLAGKEHALFVAKEGYIVVKARHHRRDFEIKIYRITSIDAKNKIAEVELLHDFGMGEWDNEPPAWLMDAIQAAKAKATCYHCREPYYAG